MHVSEQELDATEPVHVTRTDTELMVTLANRQEIETPLWGYPRLLGATPQQRAKYGLSPFGAHWPDVDEDLSIEGMLGAARFPVAGSRRRRGDRPEPVTVDPQLGLGDR